MSNQQQHRQSGNVLWILVGILAIVVFVLWLTRPEPLPPPPRVDVATLQGALLDSPVEGGDVVAAEPETTEGTERKEVTEEESEYRFLTFQPLTDYRIEEPNWDKAGEKDYVISLELEDRIPQTVRALDGIKVEMLGFMMPLDVELEQVKTFMLLANTQMCCFGQVPRINEWVYISVPDGHDVEYEEDMLVSLLGTMRVGPTYDQNEMLAGIYRIEIEEIRYDY